MVIDELRELTLPGHTVRGWNVGQVGIILANIRQLVTVCIDLANILETRSTTFPRSGFANMPIVLFRLIIELAHHLGFVGLTNDIHHITCLSTVGRWDSVAPIIIGETTLAGGDDKAWVSVFSPETIEGIISDLFDAALIVVTVLELRSIRCRIDQLFRKGQLPKINGSVILPYGFLRSHLDIQHVSTVG